MGVISAAEIQTERGQQALCIWDVAAGTVLATLPGVIDHSWSTDPNKLIARSALSISWWEVTPPALCYDVGTTVTGLSLNKVGNRLAVNDFLCGVWRVPEGLKLVVGMPHHPKSCSAQSC